MTPATIEEWTTCVFLAALAGTGVLSLITFVVMLVTFAWSRRWREGDGYYVR